MSAIVIVLEGNEEWYADTLRLARKVCNSASRSLCIVSDENIASGAGEHFIKRSGSALADLQDAARLLPAQNIVYLNGRQNIGERALNALLTQAEGSDVAISLADSAAGEDVTYLQDPQLSSLADFLGGDGPVSIGFAILSREFLLSINETAIGSFSAAVLGILVSAIQAGERVASIDAENLQIEPVNLGASERAETLNYAVATCNIEELFPEHAWSVHHEESAAASYHSLAAIFIRLGDLDSASSCLDLSDRLEDSPRSQALKALIAANRGDTLIAVANLVSSLQQYEMRKKSDSGHYLVFQPKDLQEINNRLCQGLAALNKRDNADAFDQFAEAVFQFDSFYQAFGLVRR